MTFLAPIFAAQSADISLQKSCASPGGAIVKDKLFLSLTMAALQQFRRYEGIFLIMLRFQGPDLQIGHVAVNADSVIFLGDRADAAEIPFHIPHFFIQNQPGVAGIIGDRQAYGNKKMIAETCLIQNLSDLPFKRYRIRLRPIDPCCQRQLFCRRPSGGDWQENVGDIKKLY